MGRSPILLAATMRKLVIYCEAMGGRSNCVCSPGQEAMTVVPRNFSDARLNFFSNEGRFLVSETNNQRHERLDVKRVATEIQENDELLPELSLSGPMGQILWRPGMRLAIATLFRHLYSKCDFCTYFTSDIGALGDPCPQCSRDNWASPGLYVAQPRSPEQPMRSVWYRSAPASYMVTDDLESYPLSQHKEMCHTSDFLSKRKLGETEERKKIHCLSPDEVLKSLAEWEDVI